MYVAGSLGIRLYFFLDAYVAFFFADRFDDSFVPISFSVDELDGISCLFAQDLCAVTGFFALEDGLFAGNMGGVEELHGAKL